MSEPQNQAIELDTLILRNLVIVDDEGRSRVFIGTAHDMTAITMNDDQGKARLSLSLDNQGHPGITLFHSSGATIQLTESPDLLSENGASQLMFYVSGKDQKLIFSVGMDATGAPLFLFSEAAAWGLKEAVERHTMKDEPEPPQTGEGYHEGLSLN